MVTVGNLMQKEPVTVDAGTSVIEAAKLMKACNVVSVLVARQAQIIGMVTESDVVKKFVGAEKVSYFVPVEDIMSSPVPGIEERRPLTEAADLMDKHRTLHLGATKGAHSSAWCRFGTFSDRCPSTSFRLSGASSICCLTRKAAGSPALSRLSDSAALPNRQLDFSSYDRYPS